jgi:predicted NUDIX family phosphoesterase
MDGGEDMDTALYRELEEEVGLTVDDIVTASYCGSIYSEATEVDSVHLGLVYVLVTSAGEIECLEKETLEGRWFTVDELRSLRNEGRMESWSEIVFDNLLAEEVR